MSLIFEAYCEDYEDLLDEVPTLNNDDVFWGSDTLYLFLFPAMYNDYFGDRPNLFKYLGKKYELRDTIFSQIYENKKASLKAINVLEYLNKAVELFTTENDFPYFYNFQHNDNIFLETMVNKTKLQGGYDYCVAIAEDSVEDIKQKESYNMQGKSYLIIRENIKPLLKNDLLSILNVAETGKKYNKNVIFNVI